MSDVDSGHAIQAEDVSGHVTSLKESLDELISEIVFTNSVASIIWSLGYHEHLNEVVAMLRERVGRFVEALAVENTYVHGLASFLASKIRRGLWELDLSDDEFAELLRTLVSYREALSEGRLGVSEAVLLLEVVCAYLGVTGCYELVELVKPPTPAIALQVALTSLVLSVKGLGV